MKRPYVAWTWLIRPGASSRNLGQSIMSLLYTVGREKHRSINMIKFLTRCFNFPALWKQGWERLAIKRTKAFRFSIFTTIGHMPQITRTYIKAPFPVKKLTRLAVAISLLSSWFELKISCLPASLLSWFTPCEWIPLEDILNRSFHQQGDRAVPAGHGVCAVR